MFNIDTPFSSMQIWELKPKKRSNDGGVMQICKAAWLGNTMLR